MLVALSSAAAAAAIAASGPTSNPGAVAVARALIVGVPLAAGLYIWCRRAEKRFGLLLAATGALLLVTTFAESGSELPYTIGRAAGWGVEILLVYLILSFPTGRLPERTDRFLMGAMAAVVVTLFLPRLLLAESLEVPNPYTSCTSDCPANAFSVFDQEPAILDALIRPVGTLLVLAVMVAVLMRVRQRMREATPLARRLLAPVLAVGAVRAASLALGFVFRDIDAGAWHVELTAWLLAFSIPAVVVAFFAGLLSLRLSAGGALQRLAESLSTATDPVRARLALAEALNDPTIQVVFREGASWVDAWGSPVAAPAPGSGRRLVELGDEEPPFAGVVYDEELLANSQAIESAGAIAAIVLKSNRLAKEAKASKELQQHASARIAAGAVRERRRIERDLHDGAQQRLVALRIELELAEELVRRDPERGAGRLRELEADLDAALDEVRALAHGVYPPLLADTGLTEALRAIAKGSPVQVEIDAHEVGRYPPEIESAVYFCVREALQNVLKHARGAHRVTVQLDGGIGSELRFSVRDDGAGTADGTIAIGRGLTNMRDRVAAVDGDLRITSIPQVGTTVSGVVPSAAPAG
jgi:signal transduction histidine kinase